MTADMYTPAALALCGVGTGTTVEYVEAYASLDDGFRMLGGAANCRHILGIFCEESAFDFDLGYKGTCQYVVGIQRAAREAVAMHQGSVAIVANAVIASEGYAKVTTHEFGAGGAYYNSFFYNSDGPDIAASSFAMLETSRLQWRNCLFYRPVVYELTWNDFFYGDFTQGYTAQYNFIATPGFVRFTPNWGLPEISFDLRPAADLAVDSMCLLDTVASFDAAQMDALEPVCFKGAFNPTDADQWTRGWSSLDHYGWLDVVTPAPRAALPDCHDYVSRNRPSGFGAAVSQREVRASLRDNVLTVSVAPALTRPGVVRVSVYDLSGRRVAVLADALVSANSPALRLPTESDVNGARMCVVEIDGRVVEAIPVVSR